MVVDLKAHEQDISYSFIHPSLHLPETVSINKERQLSAKSRENSYITALSN